MARHIDADLLLKDISESVVFSVKGSGSPELRGARKIIDRIENAPTADVVEVKHGVWIKPSGGLKIFEDRYVICSECNVMLPMLTELDGYYYCPRCSAEMNGERKET